MWKLKQCPRCQGDIYTHKDIHGWYEECLQCAYTRDLSTSEIFARRQAIRNTPASTRSTVIALDKEIEKEYSHRTTRETGITSEFNSERALDESYLENILKGISDFKPKKQRGNLRRKRKVVPWSIANILNPTAEKLQPRVHDFRTTLLGLSKPVPLKKLKETLLELGAIEHSNGAPLPYPNKIEKSFVP